MSSRTILVVEDYEDLRNAVAFFLRAHGYEVLQTATGNAAIQIATNQSPNLVLVDLRLPDINGVEVARELRKIPNTAHIPVVGWSADCDSEPRRQALINAGLHDCIQKPVSFRELEAVVSRFVPAGSVTSLTRQPVRNNPV